MMTSSASAKSERMKYSVLPSGVSAAEVSCRPVEITPGPSSSPALAARAAGSAMSKVAMQVARTRLRGDMRIS